MRTPPKPPRFLSLLLLLAFLLSPLICLIQPNTAKPVDYYRLLSWAVSTASFVAMLAVGGKVLRDFKSGLLIDSRNRYSLSRLQMTAWTVLAIPAILVALGSNALRVESGSASAPLAIDWTLVALMGISLTSFIATPLVLSVKADASPDESNAHRSRNRVAARQGLAEDQVCSEGSLITKRDPADARLSDMLTGEEVGNAATLDLTRIQMLAMTLIVWITYAVLVGRVMGGGGKSGWIIPKLPAFDTTLLALLAVSHAGYITGKVTPKTPGASDRTSKDLARLTIMSSNLNSLSTQITATISAGATLISGERQLVGLKNQATEIGAGINASQQKLADGGALDGEVDKLEGTLNAISTLFRALVAQGGRPQSADDPSPNLIAQIKAAVGGFEGQQFSPGDNWGAADQTLLESFIASHGLAWGDLAPQRYRAFEDVLDLTQPMLART